MKNILFSAAAIALFACSSCDYVAEPNQTTTGGGGSGVTRKVLLEEFTGHTCIACPTAALTISQLKGIYGDKLIPIAIHAGWFADPCPPHPLPNGAPTGSFSDTLTCPTSASYDASFPGMTDNPPVGMVNRLGYPTNTHSLSAGTWGSKIDSLVNEPAVASLEIVHTYNTSTRNLDVTINGRFLKETAGTYNVAIMIVEDSLVGWQIDGTVYIPDFEFEHVLRDCVNSPGSIIGTQAATGNIADQQTFTLPFTGYTVSNRWSAGHCKVIAFVYETTTREVLQAEQVDLVP